MEHNTIIDDNKSPKEIAAAFKANHKKYLIWAIVLLLLCSILVLITSAWTTPGSLNDRLYLAIMGTLVGLPMMAAIFALFFSFIPNQGLRWSQKYPRVFLWITIIIAAFYNLGMLLVGFSILVRTYFM